MFSDERAGLSATVEEWTVDVLLQWKRSGNCSPRLILLFFRWLSFTTVREVRPSQHELHFPPNQNVGAVDPTADTDHVEPDLPPPPPWLRRVFFSPHVQVRQFEVANNWLVDLPLKTLAFRFLLPLDYFIISPTCRMPLDYFILSPTCRMFEVL
jgi:hypothetical protein